MSVYCALLRGINVGGKTQIKMAELAAMFEGMGYTGAKTLLLSGNVAFKTDEQATYALSRRIEDKLDATFGFRPTVMIRSEAELRAVLDKHPFTDEQLAEPSRAMVMFLQREAEPAAVDDLLQSYSGAETIHVRGREAYLFYPDGMGRSKLTNALLEKKLKTPGTARNWNTVQKIMALVESMG